MRAWLCVIALLLGVGCVQGQAPTQEDPGDDARSWLRHLDSRIYTQPKLSALSFQFRPYYPALEGEENRKAPYFVRYRWRDGLGDTVELLGLDAEEKELKPIPSLPRHSPEQFKKVLEDYRQVARNLAGMVRGMSLSQQYRGWRGKVRRVRINDAEEIRLDLEPSRLHRLVRVVIHLNRDRVPWKLDKVYRSGARVVQHNEYVRRDEGLVIAKMTQTHTAADPSQPSFDTGFILEWRTVSGVLLPVAISRVGRDLPQLAQGKTELSALRIDDRVAPFEAMPKVTSGK